MELDVIFVFGIVLILIVFFFGAVEIEDLLCVELRSLFILSDCPTRHWLARLFYLLRVLLDLGQLEGRFLFVGDSLFWLGEISIKIQLLVKGG